MSVIIGVTVGTSISPEKLKEKLDIESDSGGNVNLDGYATEQYVKDYAQPKGDYALRSEIPAVPTKVSAFENDAGYLTEHQDISNKADKNQIIKCITPEMFGAVGDGVTDDSEAIQTAIDMASNTAVIYLDKKTYAIATGLTINTNYAHFICNGTLNYSGEDSAVTLTNSIRSVVEINTIYAQNGTAIRLSNADGYVKFCQVSVNNIRSCKVGIHLTTPSTANAPIYYNKISFMDIVASEIGIHIEPIGYYLNENRYYGGTIGGGCFYGIKIGGNPNSIHNSSANKFLSGGIEGIDENGYGIFFDNSSHNIVKNVRMFEGYGRYSLGFKGLSHNNRIELGQIKLSEIDVSELSDEGNNKNIIDVMNSTFDGSTITGEHIEVSGKYGIVYDPKKSENALNYIKISLANFPDGIIKPIGGRIYTLFQSTVYSLNGQTITLGEVYYGIGSMLKGEPITFIFGEGGGRIKLVDIDGTTIIDNTDGKFDGKTVSVSWNGFQSSNSKRVWLVNVAGETNMDGKDGYTPVKGTDYFTPQDIDEIANAVYAKVADGNGVAY